MDTERLYSDSDEAAHQLDRIGAQHVCRSCKELTEITAGRIKNRDYICSVCSRAYARTRRPALRLLWSESFKKRYADPVERPRLLARRRTIRLIKKGVLVRQPCEVCGLSEVEAHHDDYSRPADVRWLCRAHHRELHNTLPSAA